LAQAYCKNKTFNANSIKQLLVRLNQIILPFFGNRVAVALKDLDLDDYVYKRRQAGLKYSSITRELTDVKAILNWAARRHPKMIAFNPVRDYKKPGEIDRKIFEPPTLQRQSSCPGF